MMREYRTTIALLLSLGLFCYFSARTDSPLHLLDGRQEVKFEITSEKTVEENRAYCAENNTESIYDMNAEELAARSHVPYKICFGPVNDAETAVKIGAFIHDTEYSEHKPHSFPYRVYYNQTADAWIVEEVYPVDTYGDPGEFAIRKKTGQVILVHHGK
jgi:hypothetical protein